MSKISKSYLASEHLLRQILGALLKYWWLTLALLASVAAMVVWNLYSWFPIIPVTLFVLLTILSCGTLTDVFSLRKQETGITWCQISILFAIGLWIIGFIIIFDIEKANLVAVGILGSLLTWIFQDSIKGVVAFIHLRFNNLLCIDDWIKVPKYNVDGTVIRVTLTTVTIFNWDTTVSSIPICSLYGDHFVNLQKMAEGKTNGRLMCKTFLVDSECIHPLSSAEASALLAKEEVSRFLPEGEIKEGVLNAQLFRKYLVHWLMRNHLISQEPFLSVHWLEQSGNGMPLQVYTYITVTNFPAFDWEQSKIMEHVIASMGSFGLRLYQKPSSHDFNNTKEPAQ